jgi:hypothetical protein
MEVEPDRLLEPDTSPPVTVVAANDDSAAEELLRRAALWDRAIEERDEVAAAELLAPEFALELVQPVRNVMTREVWLEVVADYVVHEWDVEEQIVDVDGDYAAMLQRVRMQATVMAEDRSGIFVIPICGAGSTANGACGDGTPPRSAQASWVGPLRGAVAVNPAARIAGQPPIISPSMSWRWTRGVSFSTTEQCSLLRTPSGRRSK